MTAGGCRTRCGPRWNRCCHRGRSTRWAATTRGCRTAPRWTRSSSCCGRGASGTPWERRASARRPRPTGASRSGPGPGCSRRSGARGCWPTTPCAASIGRGWRWTGRWAKRPTLEAIPVRRPRPTRRRPQHLCLDKGFDYDEPRALAQEFGFTLHLRTRGEEASAKRRARARARRWVVERTHSWLHRFRSILIRWAKRPANYLALLHFALAIITWRHALPG